MSLRCSSPTQVVMDETAHQRSIKFVTQHTHLGLPRPYLLFGLSTLISVVNRLCLSCGSIEFDNTVICELDHIPHNQEEENKIDIVFDWLRHDLNFNQTRESAAHRLKSELNLVESRSSCAVTRPMAPPVRSRSNFGLPHEADTSDGSF